ncbi:MAG TPA: protein kinase, partial [Planctomycetota bacterium]|nr:protein kinase [Planctomycetota bacterium]
MPRLIVEKGHEKGRSIPLAAKTTIVFGRDTSANVQIKDTMASRMHFKIEPRPDGLWLVDLESLNGTLVNGHPAREARLNTGDLVRVGETTYSFLPDDAGEDPLVGKRMGGYKLLERVGRGGMGTVYKAEQVDLQRIVALKIISEEHLKNKDFVDLFVHEARAAAKLNHPNIVQVYDVKKSDDQYYFSMEFVPGGSVQDLLNRQRKIPVEETVRMILDAARGLEYAHRKEIIHRDVKPDNFMIGEANAIKIGDLGLAQRLGEKLSADDEKTVIGTPHYIAPEQVLGKPADYRSDIYSLGSTMYRLERGEPGDHELVNRKAREEAVPLGTAVSDIPPALSAICARMMARLPEQRTESMTAVIADLEGWIRDTRGETTASRESAPTGRRLLAAAVALLVVVVVGGVLGAMAMLKKSPPASHERGGASSDPDGGAAEVKRDLAVLEEGKLDDRRLETFDDVLKMYDAIVERWPGTEWAKDAVRRKEALQIRLRGLKAAKQLATLDEADREAWKQLLQTFQGGREDLAEADKMAREFQAFATDSAWKGTEAALEAGRRAKTITDWKAEVGKRRAAFESTRTEADKAMTERRYRDAWEGYNRYLGDLASYTWESKDRYNSLLYDSAARRNQELVVERARKGFEEVEKQASDLANQREFAKAVELLEATSRDSLAEPAKLAKDRLVEIHARWSEANRVAAERTAEEVRRFAELDRRDYEAAARRWHELVLRFDPKTVLAEAQALRASPERFPRLPATQALIQSRISALRTLADFKETFLRLWNDPQQPVSRKITLGTLSGTVLKVTDNNLRIGFGSDSHMDRSFAEILGGPKASELFPDFLAHLKGGLKNPDARWSMGLAILCFELGQYERALDELRSIERNADDPTKKFLAEFRPLADELTYNDADEIEAQKHFDRLQTAMKDPESAPRFDPNRELQVLRTRYTATALVAAQKAKLDEIEKRLAERGGKDREKKLRLERYQKIQALRARIQTETRNKEGEITKSIGNIKDLLERNYHLGESECAFGNLKNSTNILLEALDLGFRRLTGASRRNPMDPTALHVARIGAGLMRNLALQHQESGAADIRNKVDKRFADTGPEYQPWSNYCSAHRQWTAEMAGRIKQNGEGLDRLEKTLQDDPEAKNLWELADARETLRDYIDARALYTAVLENPEFEKVKSGDAVHRLAEIAFMFRDILEAEKLFLRMKQDYPTHPKVAQPN